MQFPIVIGLRRSRFLSLALKSIAVLGMGVALAMPWSTPFRLALCLPVSIVAFLAWRRLDAVPATIRLEATGTIYLAYAGHEQPLEAELMPGSTVHPWLTVIRLKTDSGPFPVILAADSVEPDRYRQLRVFLRWRAEVSAEAADIP